MRQEFDIGDLVLVKTPIHRAGIIVDTKLLNTTIYDNKEKEIKFELHSDEYSCKIKFFNSSDTMWIRAKMLSHLSKISQ